MVARIQMLPSSSLGRNSSADRAAGQDGERTSAERRPRAVRRRRASTTVAQTARSTRRSARTDQRLGVLRPFSGSSSGGQRRRDGEGGQQAARQRVGIGPRHRAEDVALDARQGEQRQEAGDDDRGREEDRLRDLGRGRQIVASLPVSPSGAGGSAARSACRPRPRWRKMFSTMMTVASTMMPKSMAPIDSRLADSPLSTSITTANREREGDGRRHDQRAAQIAEEQPLDQEDQHRRPSPCCAARCGW